MTEYNGKTERVLYKKRGKRVDLPVIPKLMQTQEDDAKAMVEFGRLCIYSEPGTGKTLTALRALELMQLKTGYIPETIVFCPLNAVTNWLEWAVAYSDATNLGWKIQLIENSMDDIRADATFLVCKYGTMSQKTCPILHDFKEWEADAIILDESDNACSATSVRGQRIHGVLLKGKEGGIWPMTGTPIRRYSDDLALPLLTMFPAEMAEYGIHSRTGFKAKFCKVRLMRLPHMKFGVETVYANQNMDKLHDLLYGGDEPLAIRRLLKDVAKNLPTITETVIHLGVSLSRKYKDQEKKALENDMDYAAFATSEVLPPNMATTRRMLGEEKVDASSNHIIEHLQGMRANGDKSGVLALYWHKAVGVASQDAIEYAGFRVGLISGGTSMARRALLEREFNAGMLDILIGQIATMGMAINLQHGGHTVFFIERDWSRARHIQAMGRVHRLGQISHVNVYELVVDCKMEALNTMILHRKGVQTLEIIDAE